MTRFFWQDKVKVAYVIVEAYAGFNLESAVGDGVACGG